MCKRKAETTGTTLRKSPRQEIVRTCDAKTLSNWQWCLDSWLKCKVWFAAPRGSYTQLSRRHVKAFYSNQKSVDLKQNIITWLSDRMLLTTFHSRTVSKLLPTRNMEPRDAKDGRYQRLRRRHVYLHRLAGDDVFATKIESQPKAPFIMVSCQEFEVCCKESKIRIFVCVARISHSTHEGSYVVDALTHWRQSIQQGHIRQILTNLSYTHVCSVFDLQHWVHYERQPEAMAEVSVVNAVRV